MIRRHFLPHLPNHPEKIPTRKAVLILTVQLGRPSTSLRAMVQQPDLLLQNGGIERLHLLGPRSVEKGMILLPPPPPPAQGRQGDSQSPAKEDIGHSGFSFNSLDDLHHLAYLFFPPFGFFVLFFLA